MSFRIRPAELGDIDNLYALTRMKGVKEALPGVMKVWFEHDIQQRLDGSDRHHVLVAEARDGKLIGYTRFLHRLRPVNGVRQTTAHETAVHPEYQRMGVGTRLAEARLDSALKHADGQQNKLVFKAPTDIEGNAFHRSMGFEVVGKEPSTQRDVYIYELNLDRVREQEKMLEGREDLEPER
jgi:L-amino acid N-acyltransferase YncA